MSLFTATNLAKSFGADDIFEGISVEIPHKARITVDVEYQGHNAAIKEHFLNLCRRHRIRA